MIARNPASVLGAKADCGLTGILIRYMNLQSQLDVQLGWMPALHIMAAATLSTLPHLPLTPLLKCTVHFELNFAVLCRSRAICPSTRGWTS